MRSCSRCLYPETTESLTFDTESVCSVCRQIEYKVEDVDWEARGRELDELLDRYRGKYDYDCVVPFSGGKDSTFTLWYLVKEKGLKPLVVRFDHGFLRSTVIDNSQRTFRALGVDVLHFTPSWPVVRKLMFESLRRRGDFCWHCHCGIFSYPVWVAIRYGVPLILWGEKGEYSTFYDSFDEESDHDERRFNLKVNLGINAEDMFGMLDDTVSDYPVTERDLKPYIFPPMAEIKRAGIASKFLGSYVPWDRPKQVDIIKRELDWQGDEVEGIPPEYDYEKIECFMQGVRDYLKFLKRGIGRTNHLASIDIRYGRKTREEGERLANEYDGRRPAALDVFLECLNLSEEEFYELAAKHVVSPHEMPPVEELLGRTTNRKPADYDQWSRVLDDGDDASSGD
jgi:N-acetyl sugar amidotransferase